MAELGFLGVVVKTRVQTPLFCGHLPNAGDLLLYFFDALPFLINWFTVGNKLTPQQNFNFALIPI